MKIEETKLKGSFMVTPKLFKDERGCFFESFNQRLFENITGISTRFVQDNQSISQRGVLRGLHFQKGEYAQAKLVRVVKGSILDVIVDIRPSSVTFGEHFSTVLDDKDNKQLYIPRGFAHGFLVLEDDTIFSYKCDNYYNEASEGGIIYNDKDLKIEWNYPVDELILSKKDKELPTFDKILQE